MRLPLIIVIAVAVGACASFPDISSAAPEPVIVTSDVDRFYALYDRTEGKPSVTELQEYIDRGSPGLQTLADKRNVTGERIAQAIAARPELYRNARECAEELPAATLRLDMALESLFSLYPEARAPSVTIAVGRGKPVGIGYRETGVQIGVEALCASDFLNPDVENRFVHVIAHEYIHVQQSPELNARLDSESPTVLDASLAEGIAEFVGELISGDIAYGSLRGNTDGRELEIETAFLAAKDSTDLSDWVYNSSPTEPGDLGYWVGYRIAKAYYLNAKDRRQAVAEMLEMTDPNAFFAASGWKPGMIFEEDTGSVHANILSSGVDG